MLPTDSGNLVKKKFSLCVKYVITEANHFYPCRYEILCGLRAWNSVYGESVETYIWAIHRLCVEEPFLWDGDANSMWAVWHEFGTGSTEGACCLTGEMTCNITSYYGDKPFSFRSNTKCVS